MFDLTSNQVIWTGFAQRARLSGGGTLLAYCGSVLDVATRTEIARTGQCPLYALIAISADGPLIANSPLSSEVTVFVRTGKRWKSITPL